MREWLAKLGDWFRRDKLDAELSEELRFHQSQLERDAAVENAHEASHIARRKLGNLTQARESARDEWSWNWLDNRAQDIRYALRGLRRSPGFTITVMLTLGLGIGANAAMFGVIDRLMFQPFKYLRDASTVHRVYLQTSPNGNLRTSHVIPYARFLDLQKSANTISEWAGVSPWQLAVGTGVNAHERAVVGVSASFFSLFDARPSVGRFFVAAEDAIPRGADVSVISYGFWKSEFGGGEVLGKSLQVGSLTTTIIGVAPEGFVGVAEGEPPAVFLPITSLAYGVNQGNAESFPRLYIWDWMSVLVRRKPGVTEAAATADLTRAYKLSRNAQRVLNPRVAPDSVAHPVAIAGAIKTAAGPGAGLESKTLLWVTGVAIVVLLIACANVANLMIARTLKRRQEITVRLALGVSRRRLMEQVLTESLILATLGCVTGVVIAQWMSAFLRQLLIRDGSSTGLATDTRTLVVACAAAIVAGVVTSIGPALLTIHGDLAATLRAGARGVTYQRSRTRSALLIMQGAMSVVLLVGAGLFVRSLDNVRSMHLGWNPESVLIATPEYRGVQMDSSSSDQFRNRLLAAIQAIPGVIYAARMNSLPFGTNTTEFRVDGIDSVSKLGRFNYQSTSADYFKVMGTRILRGRGLSENDRGNTPHVIVVSESMGRVLWPNKDPIGQCMYLRTRTSCSTVVGIAEDAVQQSITDSERFMYYMSDEQAPNRPGNRIFLRMTDPNPGASVERVRKVLQQLMPGQAYVGVSTLEDLVDGQRRSWRLGATMFVAFGVLALMVAAVGLYGVISYNVAQRMHELSVRIALGAQPGDVVRLVVSQGAFFAGTGVAIGIGIALFAARWIQPLLFQQSARDPVILIVVALVIGLVTLMASAAPAFRATRADPNEALRN